MRGLIPGPKPKADELIRCPRILIYEILFNNILYCGRHSEARIVTGSVSFSGNSPSGIG